MRKAPFLLLPALAAAVAAPAWAAAPTVVPDQAPISTETAQTGETAETAVTAGDAEVLPTKWSLAGPPARQVGAKAREKAGTRKPVAKAAARKPRIYGGARVSSARDSRVRKGAQVGVKLPF